MRKSTGRSSLRQERTPDTVAFLAVSNRASEPDDETDRLLRTISPVLTRFRDSKERRESLALIKAVRLARDLETCEAILRGERVPASRLDTAWRKRYGL
jgi:hypothetical protein